MSRKTREPAAKKPERKTRPAKKRVVKPKVARDCTIPGPVPAHALPRLKVRPEPAHEIQAVREYMEWQAPDEPVVHLEKVASERALGAKHDVWDVHTDKGHWWVITNPTNLYSQRDFPSMDYVLSFHVGLMARVLVQEQKRGRQGPSRERLLASWRRWEQAAEALDLGEEAEDFQAVGVRCRECLLELIIAAGDPAMLLPGEEVPKRADFRQWSGIIARALGRGASAEDFRNYLKTQANAAWTLVNCLTHARSAVRADGELAVEATQHVIVAFAAGLLRRERGVPDRCPNCSSYQVGLGWAEDETTGLQQSHPACARCGWMGDDAPE